MFVTSSESPPSNHTVLQNTNLHKALLGVGIVFVVGAILAMCLTQNAGVHILGKVCATIGAPLMLAGIIGLIYHYSVHGCTPRQSSAPPTVPSETDRARIARERLERLQ